MLNSLGSTWVAIGHTPRADNDHIVGSMMFDAAADLTVGVKSEQTPGRLAVALQVTKANDVAFPPKEYLRFSFDMDGVTSVSRGESNDVPNLELGSRLTPREKINAFLQEQGEASSAEISRATGIQLPNVSRELTSHPDTYRHAGRDKDGGSKYALV